jgi:hypothetical protein
MNVFSPQFNANCVALSQVFGTGSTAPVKGGLRRVEPGSIGGGESTTKVYFYVEDIEASLKKVTEGGGVIVKGKQAESAMSFEAIFKDTEGNVQALWQMKAQDSA